MMAKDFRQQVFAEHHVPVEQLSAHVFASPPESTCVRATLWQRLLLVLRWHTERGSMRPGILGIAWQVLAAAVKLTVVAVENLPVGGLIWLPAEDLAPGR
jgi:hypothetical protein